MGELAAFHCIDSLIHARNLSFGRAGRTLVANASLQLFPGWKVGLIGANGCGKSSFFALLRGELDAEAGDLELPPDWRIGYVAQETPALNVRALEFVLDGDSELREIEAALLDAEDDHDGHRIAELHARLADIGGYAARARAAEILAGLGFTPADLARSVAEFSGGWRVRLNLARALMSRADLLLLDEPTNHLDLEMREALTLALQETEAAVVLVSHDRHLLRTTVDELWLVADGRVEAFDGDLDDYADWLAARRVSAPPAAAEKATQRQDERAAKKQQQAVRRRLEKEVDRLERQLADWQAEKSALAERLGDPALYADRELVASLVRRDAELAAAIESAEARWLEIHAQLDTLAAG